MAMRKLCTVIEMGLSERELIANCTLGLGVMVADDGRKLTGRDAAPPVISWIAAALRRTSLRWHNFAGCRSKIFSTLANILIADDRRWR